MSRASDRLREFHEAFDVAMADTNDLESVKRVAKTRERMHEEEHRELLQALELHIRFGGRPGHTLARELADVMVIAYGTADLFGIDLDVAFDAVMDANMAKLPDCPECHGTGKLRELDLRGMDESQADRALRVAQAAGNPTCSYCNGTGKGKPIKRAPDGKVMKPPDWQEPDMSGALRPTYDPVENFRAEVRRLLVSREAITFERFNEIAHGPGVTAAHFENVWGPDERTIRLTRVQFDDPPMDVRA